VRILKGIVVPALILANLLPTTAQHSQQWKDCENGSDEKQIEACSAIIQAGRETKKNLARAYSHRGTAYSHKGDRERASKDYDEAIRLDPKSSFAYVLRGNQQKDRGNVNEAMSNYNRALKI
jgi:tetratricopeptide (TPR) repeat protein